MSASTKKKLRKEQNAAQLTEKQQRARKEARNQKLTTVIFVVVMAAILLAGLVMLVITGVKSSGIIAKNTTALTVGEHELNSVEMGYYFSDTVSRTYDQWQSEYGDYMTSFTAYMGLDLTQPLDTQEHSEGGTWADYFMDLAVDQAKANYAMYDLAIAEGYTLDGTISQTVDTNIGNIQMSALMSGYDFDDYLKLAYGSGSSEKSLRSYLEVSAIASQYYTDHQEALDFSDDDIRAHEAGREVEYNTYAYSTYYINYQNYLPEEIENVTDATDAQVDAAIAAAKVDAESLLTATTTEELDAAIAALGINADNPNAKSTMNKANLYTNVASSIQAWISDPARTAGDMAALPVETSYTNDAGETVQKELNFYVVMFHSMTDNTKPMSNVRHLLVKFEEDAEGNLVEGTKDICRTKAEDYLAQWKAGEATEETFIEFVKQYSVDGSAPDGGLFEDIYPGAPYVENWLNWCVDDARKPGDTDVIETEYGYHVMYYVSDDEYSYRDQMIIDELTTTAMETWYNGIVDAAAVTEGNLGLINTGLVLASE